MSVSASMATTATTTAAPNISPVKYNVWTLDGRNRRRQHTIHNIHTHIQMHHRLVARARVQLLLALRSVRWIYCTHTHTLQQHRLHRRHRIGRHDDDWVACVHRHWRDRGSLMHASMYCAPCALLNMRAHTFPQRSSAAGKASTIFLFKISMSLFLFSNGLQLYSFCIFICNLKSK